MRVASIPCVVLVVSGLALACGAKQEPAPTPAAIVVAPVASASTLRVREPPAAVPTASAERTAPAETCPRGCRGRANQDLEAALMKAARATRSCYNRALAQDPQLAGKLMVELTITADGAVCRSAITRNDVSPSLDECVTAAMKGPFPPPTSGCVEVTVPFNFVQSTGDGGTP